MPAHSETKDSVASESVAQMSQDGRITRTLPETARSGYGAMTPDRSRPETVAAALLAVYCPGCYRCLDWVGEPPDTKLQCMSLGCKHHGKLFKPPVVNVEVLRLTGAQVVALPPA